MPVDLFHIDLAEYPPEPTTCLRCGQEALMRFAGPCEACTSELRTKFQAEARAIDADYVPKMNVTPNAVALKGD